MKNSGNTHCMWVKKTAVNKLSKLASWLFVLTSMALSGCASTGHLSTSTHIKLQQIQPTSLTSRLIDARPISEKIYRLGVKQNYPESVALGDENFNPDRLHVLGNRLQNALGSKLKDADRVSVERFEVFEYVRDIKTPTAGEIVGSYNNLGVTAPRNVSPSNFSVAETLALPIAVPIRQIMDRVITSEAEVELHVTINGKLFISKMAAALPDVNREYGISEAFELAFKYLVYDLEAALPQ